MTARLDPAPNGADLARLHGLDGTALVRAALAPEVLGGHLALVSSFGSESAVLLDMVASTAPGTPVIFLDTEKLFPETRAYRDELVELLGLTDVRAIRPEPAALRAADPAGDLWQSDADACCALRKVEPLERALRGFRGWITGRKRFQGASRARLETLERDPATGRIKINPLASWSEEEVEKYRTLRGLPPHPLVAQGYRSIGCAPCTRVTKPGEGARAGRWAHLDKTECGIHGGGI